MIPQTQERKPRNSSKINLLISLTFHSVLVVGLLYFAAREGMLGQQIRKIAVEMVKEKPKEPEKAKEPEKPKEVPKVETPKIATVTPKITPTTAAPPPATDLAPAAVAPPAAAMPAFDFGGGAAVESSTNVVEIYRSQVENALRSKWDRPMDIADNDFVAEVEVTVDRSGQIGNPVWQKHSPDKRWDDSVSKALAVAKSLNRPPPPDFPSHVLVRFDVVAAASVPILPQ